MEEEKKVKEKLTPTIDLFESSIKVWWKNLAKFIMVSVWGFIYALIPMAAILVLTLSATKSGMPTGYLKISSVLVFTLGLCVVFYFMARSYMALFLLIKKNYEGKPLEIFKETRSIAFPYIGLALLTAVLVLLWSLLLIIPGLIFSVFYSFAIYTFFFENKRGMKAIKRSKELVKGYFWPVLGRIIFLAIILWVFGMVVAAPLGRFPQESFSRGMYSYFVQLLNFIITPISLLYSYNIYRDLVKIKK